MKKLSVPRLAALIARAKWIKKARGAQLTPYGAWRIWLILAGRGWGKTRTGAEDIAAYCLWHSNVRVGIIAPTYADARDVCIEGESGLLGVLPSSCVQNWRRSTGDLLLYNGSRIKIYSADQPERLRGPQHHRVWCDELGAWPSRDAFDQMWFGLRLGNDPRVIVTTTPRRTEIICELLARVEEDVFLTHGRTMDNRDNLAPAVLAQLERRYAGTRLGRQELEAELLEDTEGSLWTRDMIENARALLGGREFVRVVVAVDPALSDKKTSDETGIVAAGLCEDGVIYILADWSCQTSPEAWARRVIACYHEFHADLIVAEVNAGGALVERLLRQADPLIAFKEVRALRGKMERAMPVAALYEQGRVKHVAPMEVLEDQMARFAPLYIGSKSPDRVDALVWAVTELSGFVKCEPRVRRV
ncbi:MAG: terminase family protein [Bdellovibrionales bacterium]